MCVCVCARARSHMHTQVTLTCAHIIHIPIRTFTHTPTHPKTHTRTHTHTVLSQSTLASSVSATAFYAHVDKRKRISRPESRPIPTLTTYPAHVLHCVRTHQTHRNTHARTHDTPTHRPVAVDPRFEVERYSVLRTCCEEEEEKPQKSGPCGDDARHGMMRAHCCLFCCVGLVWGVWVCVCVYAV